MKVKIVNGPNLNLLGQREPSVYGRKTLADIETDLVRLAGELELELTFFQSNMEGELVEAIQEADRSSSGVVLNAAAYTHTSVAVRDAVAAVAAPVVEVHLSNPAAREEFRRTSLLSGVCAGSISGFGPESYALALFWFARQSKPEDESVAV